MNEQPASQNDPVPIEVNFVLPTGQTIPAYVHAENFDAACSHLVENGWIDAAIKHPAAYAVFFRANIVAMIDVSSTGEPQRSRLIVPRVHQ